MPKQRARNRAIQAEREAQKERDRQLPKENKCNKSIKNAYKPLRTLQKRLKHKRFSKTDCRSSEAYAKLKKANEDVENRITTEESTALLQSP